MEPANGRIVDERRYEHCAEQIICVGEDWYRRVVIAHDQVRECQTIGLTEARRLLLTWGHSPASVWEMTRPKLDLSTGSSDA